MNRLLKPVAFALALVLVLALFPVVANAATVTGFGLDQNSYELPSDDKNHTVRFEFYLTYDGIQVTSLPAGVTDFKIEAREPVSNNFFSEIFGDKAYTDFPAGGLFVFTFGTKADAFNSDPGKTYTWEFTVSYKVNGSPAKDTILAQFEINNGQDTIDNPNNPNDNQGSEGNKDKYQTPYDITLIPTEIAKDDEYGNLDLRVHLAYQGDRNFQDAPLSYFRMEPVISSEGGTFPFEMAYSSYAKELKDLVEVRNSDGEVVETYFDFPFKVKKDAVNGFYPITFKIYHLYQNTNLQETTPAETTITTYVQIRHGKEAEDEEEEENKPDPSTAILLLEGYTLAPEEIKAGDEFDLTLRIRNTSDHTVTDVKSTLEEANKTIVPVNGSNSFFIERVGAGKTVEHTLRVKATAMAGVEPVSLTLKNEFVQEDAAKSSTDTFTIPVVQVANLSLDPPNYPVDCYQGDSFNLMMNLYNKGKSTLYNVSVRLESDSMTADENYYAGNMDSGASKEYDVMVTPNMDASGQVEGDIVVTYEDSEGNVTEKRTPITINVASMDYGMDDPMIMDPSMETMGEGMPEQTGFPVWAWIVIGVVVAGAAVAVVIVVRKRKKAKVDDDEMD